MRNFYYYDVFCDKDSIKFGLVILLEFFYVGFERIQYVFSIFNKLQVSVID